MADFDHTAFADLTKVSLIRPVIAQGIAMPAGARGVVLVAWADGSVYKVEFDTPRHVLLTVKARDLTV